MIIDLLGRNTYKDYLIYEENERIELIEGEIFNMTPAPSRIHHKLTMAIVRYILLLLMLY